jgi:hypothetical protein
MAPPITWGALRPASWPADRAGDIFIVRNTRAQSRWNGTAWEIITAPLPHTTAQTRADVLPIFPSIGLKDQILARTVSADPHAVDWVDPGPGLIWQDDFTSLSTWVCNHALRNKFVSVLAIKDDGTIMVPDIDYANADPNIISLKFEEAVSGTAIIRR